MNWNIEQMEHPVWVCVRKYDTLVRVTIGIRIKPTVSRGEEDYF